MNFKKTWKRFFTVSRASEGFTLVELIVVIAILAILAGIAVPAYSGYIKKANKAADLQLLGAVNTAFAAAALENGDDVNEIASAALRYGGSEGAVTVTGVASVAGANAADYEEAFLRYYSGNTSSTFKVITGLYFSNGAFVEGTMLTVTSGDRTYTYVVDPSSAQALADSTFMNQMGPETTLEIMDMVSTFASGFQGASLDAVLADPTFLESFADYIGTDYTYTEGDDPEEVLSTLLGDNDEGMIANALVLFAADQSTSLSTDSVKTLLGTEDVSAEDTIRATLANDPATAMAQTAAAYSLYTSYLYSRDDTYTNAEGVTRDVLIANLTSNPLSVLDGLDDDGFKDYINNSGDDDINGYLSAMGMLGGAAQSDNGVGGTVSQDILAQGFDTEWMAQILGQVRNG